MKILSFKYLTNELRPYILKAAGQKAGDMSTRHVPNGRIVSPDVRLLVQSVGSLEVLNTT
jgi:hypothetical protein